MLQCLAHMFACTCLGRVFLVFFDVSNSNSLLQQAICVNWLAFVVAFSCFFWKPGPELGGAVLVGGSFGFFNSGSFFVRFFFLVILSGL